MTASNTPAQVSRIHQWLAARSAWQRRGIAVVAGALATLGHAPFQLTLLFVAAITVLVWLLDGVADRKNKRWSAFGVGFYFGLGHLTTGLYWVSSAFNVDSGAWGPIWGIPATLGLAAGLALFWGAGCALAMAFWTADARRIPWFAVSIFASEWLRGHLFGGFPGFCRAMSGRPASQCRSSPRSSAFMG
ncbi:MAG: hypothetical protein M0D54_21550 [Hyphomonadaceae bacterium JAD_PAG50586_4]|nr:MAG: hypothetical protein M0D54_21550 [Hyphomonadaceae bacterium JAD_PAG50586_4]